MNLSSYIDSVPVLGYFVQTPSEASNDCSKESTMKNILGVLLVCSAGLAAADPSNPCGGAASAAKQTYADVASTKSGFGCAPFPVGKGTTPTVRSNAAGTVAWWYCPADGGQWRLDWAAATAESLSGKDLLDDAYKVIAAADSKAAFNAITAMNVKLPLSDPKLTPVWCPFVGEMLAGTPKSEVVVTRETPASSPPAPHRP